MSNLENKVLAVLFPINVSYNEMQTTFIVVLRLNIFILNDLRYFNHLEFTK